MSTTLLYIIIIIAVLSLLAYFLQDRFIFKPEKLRQDLLSNTIFLSKNYFLILNPVFASTVLHFYRDNPQGLILYFHGNTRSIKGWAKYATDFYRYDYDVVLVDYRGFGKSTGKRTEKEMMNDMQFVYEQLLLQYPEHHILVYGRSLGSGFASKIACDNKPRYLILDAPFYNFTKVVERFLPFLPVKFLLHVPAAHRQMDEACELSHLHYPWHKRLADPYQAQ